MNLLTMSKDKVLDVIYFICRAFVEWYFRYYDLDFKHDIECYLDYPKK